MRPRALECQVQKIVRREAERAALKPLERPDEQIRAEEQKNTQGCLNGHERVGQPPMGAQTTRFLQCVDQRCR